MGVGEGRIKIAVTNEQAFSSHKASEPQCLEHMLGSVLLMATLSLTHSPAVCLEHGAGRLGFYTGCCFSTSFGGVPSPAAHP